MKVKVINKSGNLLPYKNTFYSSGYDIRANLISDDQLELTSKIALYNSEIITYRSTSIIKNNLAVLIKPFGQAMIPTGLFVEIEFGYHLEILSRSGMATSGIIVTNAPGIIDSDYRGEIKVLLTNLSNNPYTIMHGDKIAQLLLVKDIDIEWEEVENLSDSLRNTDGFGSSDMKGVHNIDIFKDDNK